MHLIERVFSFFILVVIQKGWEEIQGNKNFDKIDSKFDKSYYENNSNLNQIREKMSLIDRAQQNISSLTENVVDLKNFLASTSQRGRFGEMILENLISDYLPKDYYEFQKTLSNNYFWKSTNR